MGVRNWFFRRVLEFLVFVGFVSVHQSYGKTGRLTCITLVPSLFSYSRRPFSCFRKVFGCCEFRRFWVNFSVSYFPVFCRCTKRPLESPLIVPRSKSLTLLLSLTMEKVRFRNRSDLLPVFSLLFRLQNIPLAIRNITRKWNVWSNSSLWDDRQFRRFLTVFFMFCSVSNLGRLFQLGTESSSCTILAYWMINFEDSIEMFTLWMARSDLGLWRSLR